MSDLDLEERLRSELHTALGDGPRTVADWDDVERRLGPAVARRRTRVVLAVAAVAVVAIAAVSVVATRSDGERVKTGPVGPGPTSSTVPGSTTSTAAPLDTRVQAVSRTRIDSPGEMIATSAGAWVISGNIPEGPAPVLLHVDSSGRVVSRTALPGVTQAPVYLASGEGSIWAGAWVTGTLFRIDPGTGRITGQAHLASMGQGGEIERVAAGLGHVWVRMCCDQPTGSNQRLVQIDPSTMQPQSETGVPGDGESGRVVVGPQDVFTTGEDVDKVGVVDPSNLHAHEVGVAGGAGPVVAGDGVWVIGRWYGPVGAGFALSTVDPVGLTSHQVLTWPEAVGQLAAGRGVLWARTGVNSGSRIFVVVHGKVTEVPATEQSVDGGIAANAHTLWAFEGNELVQYHWTP
jgi:hypothetical protein